MQTFKVKIELKSGSKHSFRIKTDQDRLKRIFDIVDKAVQEKVDGLVLLNKNNIRISEIAMYSFKPLKLGWF